MPNLTRRFAAWLATDARVRKQLRSLQEELDETKSSQQRLELGLTPRICPVDHDPQRLPQVTQPEMGPSQQIDAHLQLGLERGPMMSIDAGKVLGSYVHPRQEAVAQ